MTRHGTPLDDRPRRVSRDDVRFDLGLSPQQMSDALEAAGLACCAEYIPEFMVPKLRRVADRIKREHTT